MKKHIISFMAVFLILINISGVSAQCLSVNEIDVPKILDSVIPDDVYNYASKRLLPLARTVKNDSENFGAIISNVNNISLGTPYVIFDAENEGEQNTIYYFPVVENNMIKCVLSISKYENIYSASLCEDISQELNNINYYYNKNYIFYYDGQNICAESNKGTETLNVVIDNDIDENAKENVEYFENLSFYQKIRYIKKNYGTNSNSLDKNAVSTYDKAKGFSSKTSTIVRLNTSGCLVQQYSDGNCWAASVATTLRYLYYSKYKNLTARNVCDKIGVGYDEGGNLVTRQRALNAYGVYYYNHFLSSPMEFGLIQKNILNQRLILASCVGLKSGSGHAVTAIGYTTYGGIKQVVLYNSGNNKCVTVEYKIKGLTFSYNNESYRWRSSLSCY